MRRVICTLMDLTPDASAAGDLLGAAAVFAAAAAAGALAAVVAGGRGDRRVSAGRQHDAQGKPRAYTLTFGEEAVTLDPGKSWVKVDAYKWVTRGLIEEPQSFHILPNGAVDINAERILLEDPEGTTKLEHEINKHHPPSVAHKPPTIVAGPIAASASEEAGPAKVHFKVRLDHLGHLMVECSRGAERVETGLRGLPSLVTNGFMLGPRDFHVDPLQRWVEIDGARFECTEGGAAHLQVVLNNRYAPTLKANEANIIAVRENAASATGFDIDFVTVHAGARLEVKGHLSQERLDILQDHKRCDLLHPGTVLRLSPPHLLIRRRRADGGEEPITEIPDVHYLRASAAQLQEILNHPLVRRHAASTTATPAAPVSDQPARLSELRVVRNPGSRLFLWLECVFQPGGKLEGKAFTHHNVAELQHRGVFRENLDVSLSLDNHRLGILNKETHQEEIVALDSQSTDADLARASQLLSDALVAATSGASLAAPPTAGASPV